MNKKMASPVPLVLLRFLRCRVCKVKINLIININNISMNNIYSINNSNIKNIHMNV